MFNLKDIIRMNQEIGEEGMVVNKSALEYALDRIHREKSWIRQSAMLIRSIVCDHAFHEGNKRTAFILFTSMSELNKWDYDPARLAKTIHDISRKNIVDIGKIERMLENAIRKDA
jgi:prophage maintenance system killer protein